MFLTGQRWVGHFERVSRRTDGGHTGLQFDGAVIRGSVCRNEVTAVSDDEGEAEHDGARVSPPPRRRVATAQAS